jgi:peptidoglycan hydrolase-like protein with peptidoglycan-binding domain
MTFSSTLGDLLAQDATARVLAAGSSASGAITVLRSGLVELGFRRAGTGRRMDPHGVYGAATTEAVRQFAQRNGLRSNGTRITAALARRLLHRHGFLDDLRHLQGAVDSPAVLRKLYRGSADKVHIAVLQEILNELGYGAQLKWARYGADGVYGRGTTAAVKAFSADEGIASDGERVTHDMAASALQRLVPHYGDHWRQETRPVTVQRLSVKRSNARITVSDGERSKTFRIYRRGVYTNGTQKPGRFIEGNPDLLVGVGLTPSSLKVMLAVSANEGNLDAINTWDDAFFTFGMFQWTVGQRSAAGELPALIKKLKEREPGVFERYFLRHGLDVSNDTGAVTGRFTLNGTKIRTPEQKEQLRTAAWAFRFWKAGQDPSMQTVEVAHALSRLGTFYRSRNHQVAGHDIADIITSEFGVALILDNHVNRPAYVRPCLEAAVKKCEIEAAPGSWTTADERRVIDAYLTIRERYGRSPMTDARKRGQNTRRALARGVISGERGSFRMPG